MGDSSNTSNQGLDGTEVKQVNQSNDNKLQIWSNIAVWGLKMAAVFCSTVSPQAAQLHYSKAGAIKSQYVVDAGPISNFNQSESSNPVNFLYLKFFTLNGVLNLYIVQLMEVSIWLWCQVTEIWAVWQKEKACNSNCIDENHHFIA